MAGKKKKVLNELKYRDRKIEVVEENVGQGVHIDGKKALAERDADTGAYVSPEAPYETYGTLEDLAKAIVDRRRETS